MLRIQTSQHKETVQFPEHPMSKDQEKSKLEHLFEYQFDYDSKPAYKHVGGYQIYLYWNSDNGGEWMVSNNTKRNLVPSNVIFVEKRIVL